jgi:hypothetical protein
MSNLYGVTGQMIGKCHLVIPTDGTPRFYKVESMSGEIDPATGQVKEYDVKAFKKGKKWFYTCTCEAGQKGFVDCKLHQYCWHVRASLACAEEEKIAMHEQAALAAEQREAEERQNDQAERQIARSLVTRQQEPIVAGRGHKITALVPATARDYQRVVYTPASYASKRARCCCQLAKAA